MTSLLTKSTHVKRWQMHKQLWSGCTECQLCLTRSKVVLCRGKLPAPTLFLGEAPGESENILGYPFTGPSGKLFDDMVGEVEAEVGGFRYAITNTVACIPPGEDTATREPSKLEIERCRPRLLELIQLCRPKLIVYLGRVAAKQHKTLTKLLPREVWQGEMLELIHPSAILHQPPGTASLSTKRFILSLTSKLVDMGLVEV